MAKETVVGFIEKQEWLKPAEDAVQNAVGTSFEWAGPSGKRIKDFLHGVWLGHPLHPVLTDIPLGAWTAAAVLDVMDAAGSKGCSRAARMAINIGLAGAVGAAVTGLTEWKEIDGGPRRIGIVHGILNLAATSLYLTSSLMRRNRKHSGGRAFAFAGLAVGSVSAWLGGHLVFERRIGVDHSVGPEAPRDWVPVLGNGELSEGQMRRVDVNGCRILLVRREGQVRAVGEVCSHLGGPLAEGKLEGDGVRCPWHGSCFSVEDGRVLEGPSTHPQPVLQTRVRDGRIEVKGMGEGGAAEEAIPRTEALIV